jgi:hypothetical protein
MNAIVAQWKEELRRDKQVQPKCSPQTRQRAASAIRKHRQARRHFKIGGGK